MTPRFQRLFLLLVLAVCVFAALAAAVALLFTVLPEPSPEPKSPPILGLWLPYTHDGTYVPGTWTTVQLYSNRNAYVDVYTIDAAGSRQREFQVEVTAGQYTWREWQVPGTEGQWHLEARLNDDWAIRRRAFTVKWDLTGPEIGQAEFFPPIRLRLPQNVAGGPICPGGTAELYVRVLDGSELQRVELRTRYPPGAGDWVPDRMEAAGNDYHHPLPARVQPGTEYYVYAEDVYGNWSTSPPGTYTVEPCFEILYDFVAEAPGALWTFFHPNPYETDYAGANRFDPAHPLGGAHLQDEVFMEDASVAAQVLEAFPPQVVGGEIWGRYRLGDLLVEPGDQFLARVGLEAGAKWGDTIFGVRFQSGDPRMPVTTMVTFPELREGDDRKGTTTWMVPLPGELSGDYFDLVVDAGSAPFQDRAVWVEARLLRPLD
jgi:hypothetical protein